MAERDYYDVLGVARNVSADEIKRAYRKLARKYHPDVNPGDKAAERKFKEVQEAYDVVGDPDRRKKYDQFGRAAFESGAAGPGGKSWSFRWGGSGRPTGSFDFGGFDLGKMFGEQFGGGPQFETGSRRPREAAGRDIEHEVRIPFLVAALGGEVQVSVRRNRPCSKCRGTRAEPGSKFATCSACGGSGQRSGGGPFDFGLPCELCSGEGKRPERMCGQCHGSGATLNDETITVKISAGVDDSSRIRLREQGEVGPSGRSGDLFVLPRVDPHPLFERKDHDIIVRVPVTVTEAGLGTKIDVPTLDGTVTMTIPPGTSSGQRLRIRGRGIPKGKGPRGDQFVEVKIVLPTKLNEQSRELLRRFAELNPENPRESMGK